MTQISRAGIPKRPLPNCRAGPTASSTPLLLVAQMLWGGHPQLGRPADYLPLGTVGQWLPAPCNGGPCARAATRKPTMWGRLGPWAGMPKRTSDLGNCHATDKGYSQTSVDCVRTKRGGGPKTPLCEGKGPENPGVVAPFAVAGCRGNRRRAVDRRLGKIDLRPCPLRLRSSFSSSTKC